MKTVGDFKRSLPEDRVHTLLKAVIEPSGMTISKRPDSYELLSDMIIGSVFTDAFANWYSVSHLRETFTRCKLARQSSIGPVGIVVSQIGEGEYRPSFYSPLFFFNEADAVNFAVLMDSIA